MSRRAMIAPDPEPLGAPGLPWFTFRPVPLVWKSPVTVPGVDARSSVRLAIHRIAPVGLAGCSIWLPVGTMTHRSGAARYLRRLPRGNDGRGSEEPIERHRLARPGNAVLAHRKGVLTAGG